MMSISAEEVLHRIVAAVDKFASGAKLHDDTDDDRRPCHLSNMHSAEDFCLFEIFGKKRTSI